MLFNAALEMWVRQPKLLMWRLPKNIINMSSWAIGRTPRVMPTGGHIWCRNSSHFAPAHEQNDPTGIGNYKVLLGSCFHRCPSRAACGHTGPISLTYMGTENFIRVFDMCKLRFSSWKLWVNRISLWNWGGASLDGRLVNNMILWWWGTDDDDADVDDHDDDYQNMKLSLGKTWRNRNVALLQGGCMFWRRPKKVPGENINAAVAAFLCRTVSVNDARLKIYHHWPFWSGIRTLLRIWRGSNRN